MALSTSSLLLLLWFAACSNTSSDTVSGSETNNLQTTVKDTESSLTEREAADNIAVETETENLTDTLLALSGDGLLLIDEQSGKTQTIPFDTDIATSTVAISSVLGEPMQKNRNSECSAGAMSFITWSNGLSINAIKDRFVGWTVHQNTESANLTTVNNIGLGKTLADLEANYNVEVTESTLGIEFVASDSLFGLLSANKPDGIIINLWSGIACNFR
ncbi:hypothetical protein [Myxosarcina sp. GI1]|uniref:hypothetical protein n=1 Tax=Myxosarcina sp. GI1 TaxID=1541065 RepID=UPI00056C9D81|nr:hypothetical protein [Myxosarcina sp. GI1]